MRWPPEVWEGAGGPYPLENYKPMGFLSNTGLDLLTSTKLLSQHSMLGQHRSASETLAGLGWPAK